MSHPVTSRAGVALLATLALAGPARAGAVVHAEIGTRVENWELPTITGQKERLFSPTARANLMVFFRTGQERSVDALTQLATCEKAFAGKPVRWVGVVSDSEDLAAVRSLVARTGVHMPVLVDSADALYGRLNIRLHPMIVFVDAGLRVDDVEMYRQIDYCEIVTARIRLLLGEIDQAGFEAVVNPARGSMPGDDPRDVARRDVNLGRMLLRRKQLDQALAAAQKALERAPMAAAFSLMGDVAQARGDCPTALKRYEQALKLDPKDVAALSGRAACAQR
jgi:tetratricopeptide (TPR) repeat protein